MESTRDEQPEILDVLARAAAIAAVLAGGALVWAAMTVYPGGTAWNAEAPGHDFWLNFLCDLQRTTARGGAPNALASHLTQGAMATLALSFIAHFWLTARLAQLEARTTRIVLVLGLLTTFGTLNVAFMPTDTYGALHDIGIAAGTLPGLVAVGILLPSLARAPDAKLAAVVGAAFLAIASVDFVLYVHQLVSGTRGTPVIPILERLSFLLLLVWMLVVALTGVDDPAETGSGRAPRRLASGRLGP
jgi:hypothetical protein